MDASRTQSQLAGELDRKMAELHRQVERLNQELVALNEAAEGWRSRKRRMRSPLDPLELLRRLVDGTIRSLERATVALVERVMG